MKKQAHSVHYGLIAKKSLMLSRPGFPELFPGTGNRENAGRRSQVDIPFCSFIITHFAGYEEFMYISLVRMPADGLRFEHRYATGELDTSNHEFELVEPPNVTGRIDRTGIEMRVRGEIKTSFTAMCDRCLIDVPFSLVIPFDLLYAPEDPGAGRSGETEIHDRDLDISIYDHDQIDLDALVLEQIELSLPSRLLCSEDCRGLCPECGASLNEEECGCKKPVDPRWQALADLADQVKLNKLNESPDEPDN